MKTQNEEILAYLETGKPLTATSAIRAFRCYRLAARICDLRNAGHRITTETVKRRSKRTGKPIKYAAYSLVMS